MSFSFGDIRTAFTIAQQVYSIGFSEATSANRQYREFGDDVKSLANNLFVLDEVLKRAHKQSSSRVSVREFRGLSNLNLILGNFRQTLDECEKLLSEKTYFQKEGGFVKNILWNIQGAADDVLGLRERVRFHNIKLSTALSTLEIHVVQDLHYRMQDALSQILNRIDDLSRQLREDGEENEDSNEQPATPFLLPYELEQAFLELARQRYVNLGELSLTQGLDSAVYYLDRVTKKPLKPTQREKQYVTTVLNLMKAHWLLNTTKECREYVDSCLYRSTDAFENQMMTWGMTVDKFVQKLEEDIAIACGKIRAHRSDLPEAQALLESFDREKTIWSDENLRVKELEPDKAILGDEFMTAELHDSDPSVKKTLQLFHRTDTYATMVITEINVSGGGVRDKVQMFVLSSPDNSGIRLRGDTSSVPVGIVLDRAHLIPEYAIRSSTTSPYSLKFKEEEQNPFVKTLSFKEPPQMLKFQQGITGYKVIYDIANITLTYQQSNSLFGGSSVTQEGRLQIWNAPWSNPNEDASILSPLPPQRGTRSLFSLKSTLDTSPIIYRGRAGSRNSSVNSAPTNVLGTRSEPFGSETTSATSAGSIDSMHRASNLSSKRVLPGASDSNEPINIILSRPIPPCLVFFAMDGDSPRSFLVIDVDGQTFLNKDLCDCNSRDPLTTCLRTVVVRRSSTLTAFKSKDVAEAKNWNIAEAGLYQRKSALEPVKRIKHLVLSFGTGTADRSQFENRFDQVTKLAAIRMNKYLAIN